jgi:O-antigen ligase
MINVQSILGSKLKSNSEQTLRVLFLIAIFTIPIWPKLSTKLIVITLILALILYLPKFSLRFFLSRSWDLFLYILVLLLGLFWTTELVDGFRVLETSFSLLALPILFATVVHREENFIDKIIRFFIYGTLVASLVCLGLAWLRYFETGDTAGFFYYELTGSINSHPTYHAYYVIFAITVFLYQLNEGKVRIHVGLTILLVLFLFFILILTSGRTAYASLLLVFSYFILKSILEPISSTMWVVVILIGLMIAILFVLHSGNYFRNEGDYWERFELWKSALQANTNPLFGVGTGDYKLVLNEFYRQVGLEKFAQGNYNSHNQFIQIYFVHGLVGLISLLILIVRPLYITIRNRITLGTLLFFPFIIYGINEVFLDRYQGVVFFAIVHQLLMNLKSTDQVWPHSDEIPRII